VVIKKEWLKNCGNNGTSNKSCLPDVIRGTQRVDRRCIIMGCKGRTGVWASFVVKYVDVCS
jgi:hypothetical protein